MSEETKRTPQVFLSFAQEDKRIAHRIAEALRTSGTRVLYDSWELAPGDSLQSRITKSIAASDYLVVLLSTHSVQSRWVQSELQATLLSEMDDRAITVIPVLVDHVTVPTSLRDRLYLDLTKNEELGIAQLQRQLSAAPDIDFSLLSYSSFESLVDALLTELGFETTRLNLPGSKDFGFDFSATFRGVDPFGHEQTTHWLVECKLYKQERVSVTLLQKLFAILYATASQDHALVVTTGRLTSVARNFIAEWTKKTGRPLRVIDGNELTALLLKHPRLIKEFFPQGAR
jgi:TIR domain/Restriction endonuclease